MKTFATLFVFLLTVSLITAQEEYYEEYVDTSFMEENSMVEDFLPSEAHLADLEASFYAPYQTGTKDLSFAIPVRNKGAQASTATKLQITYVWETAKGQRKSIKKLIEVPAIPANSLITLSLTLTSRSFQSETNPETAHTIIMVDPYNKVSERNETNNFIKVPTKKLESDLPNEEMSSEEGMMVTEAYE